MLLSEMRNSLRRRIGSPSLTDTPEATLTQILNDSMREIMDKYPFHMSRSVQTFPTVAGTKRYDLPLDLASLFKVWDATSRYQVKKRDMRWLATTENQLTDSRGRPLYYVRELDWIQFFPIPDAVYTISLFYKNTIADLVNDSDEPLIPEAWHPGIVRYARYLYYDEIQDTSKATYAYNSWKIWLSDKPSEIAEETVDDDEAVEVPTLGHRAYGRAYRDRWETQE